MEFDPSKKVNDNDAGGVMSGLKTAVGRYVGGTTEERVPDAASPVDLPGFMVHMEIPRNEIASLTTVKQKVGDRKDLPFLRIGLVDGSTIDVSDEHNDERVQRMVAMSHGQG